MTRTDHPTGTDRLAEAAAQLGLDERAIVVNVQGDEPLLEPALIRAVAVKLTEHSDAAIATACHPIANADEAFNPNVVKVVLDHAGYALYFSRATIPWARDAFAADRRAAARRDCRCTGTTGCTRTASAFLRRYPIAGAGAARAFRGARAVARAVARLPDRRQRDARHAGTRRRHAGRSRPRARSSYAAGSV